MNFTLEKELDLQDELFDASYHPTNSNLIAVTTISGNVHILESFAPKLILKRHHKGTPIRRVRFDTNGRMITIARTVKVYDLETNTSTYKLIRDDDLKTSFYSLKSLANNFIAAGDDDGHLMVWDTRTSNNKPLFKASDCDQYISDIDAQYEGRRLIVCTSGEGTLTAYDMRNRKMIEPQSELFEAGFQCLRLDNLHKKVIVGGEDCALYIFNQDEWAHTSDKFALARNCNIECLDMNSESLIFAGCSDGRVRVARLWPHIIISSYRARAPIDSVQAHSELQQLIACGENYLNVINYEEVEEDSEEEEKEKKKKTNETSSKSDFWQDI